MLGVCVCAPLADGLAKLLGQRMPLGQMIALRFLLQAVLLGGLALSMGIPLALPRRILGMTVVRTVLHVGGVGAMFLSLRHLPLADAVAIAFVAPFFLLLLGKLLLGETVGPRRAISCAVGFAGTLLVVQPSFVEVGAAAFLPMAAAAFFALFMLATRSVARDADPIALMAVSGAMAAVLGPALLVAHAFGLPETELAGAPAADWALLLLLGVVGSVTHLLIVWSLRFAPAATQPMQYLEIPVATLIGYLMFDELPNALAAVGIAVTVAAGLHVVRHESRDARRRPLPISEEV